jgi:hypothetical protein
MSGKNTTTSKIDPGCFIEVNAWSGQARPYAATVTTNTGRYLGRTGFCKSEYAARRAAERIVCAAYLKEMGERPLAPAPAAPAPETCFVCGAGIAAEEPTFHEERYGHTPEVYRDRVLYRFDTGTYSFQPVDALAGAGAVVSRPDRSALPEARRRLLGDLEIAVRLPNVEVGSFGLQCSVADETCSGCPPCYRAGGIGVFRPGCDECWGTGCVSDAHRGRRGDEAAS